MNPCGFSLKRWAEALVLLSTLVVVVAGTPPIAPPDTTLIDDRKQRVDFFTHWRQTTNVLIRRTLQFRKPQPVTIVTNPPVGIGLIIAQAPRGFVVRRVIAGTPAFRAGVSEGDVIIAIDGKPAAKLELDDAARHILGQIGSYVELTLFRSAVEQPLRIKLQREVLPQPPAFILDD